MKTKLLTVYHGTAARFDEFGQENARVENDYFGGGLAYFTSSRRVAYGYARSAMLRTKSKIPYIIYVGVQFDKLFDARNTSKWSGERVLAFIQEVGLRSDQVEAFIRGAGLLDMSSLQGRSPHVVKSAFMSGKIELDGESIFMALSRVLGNMAQARKKLMSLGYDGLCHIGGEITKDKLNRGKHTVFISYDKKTIRSFDRKKIPLDRLEEKVRLRDYVDL